MPIDYFIQNIIHVIILAGFTGIAEALPPERVVALLGLWFEAATARVEAESGIVNKTIGDGILAVFGVPGELPDHAERALRAVEGLGGAMRAKSTHRASASRGPGDSVFASPAWHIMAMLTSPTSFAIFFSSRL